MALKMFLNVVYTIGIALCLFTFYWGFTHGHYPFVAGAVVVGGAFVMLKLRLLKEVRAMQDPRSTRKK
jgi:hypothetical protein